MSAVRLTFVALTLALTACTDPPRPAPVAQAGGKAPARQTVAASPETKAQLPAPEAIGTQEIAPGVEIPKKLPNGIPLMTPMDFALCMVPAAEMTTPEHRRQRAYARRKLIMNNPDSPTARALADLADAARAGELGSVTPAASSASTPSTKNSGVVFSLPGTPPKGGRPPAGSRPREDSETKAAEPSTQ